MRIGLALSLIGILLTAGCGGGDLEGRNVDDSTIESLMATTYGKVPDLPEVAGRTGAAFDKAKDWMRKGTDKIADSAPMPTKSECEQIGDAVVVEVFGGNPPSSNAAAVARVEQIAGRLMDALPKNSTVDYRFQVLDSNQVNAFMAIGGRGVVYTGLLSVMSKDDQVAAVLAHELAHGEHAHAIHSVRLSMAGARMGEKFGAAEMMAKLVGSTLRAVYDQDMEFEADRLGFCLAWRAGFDPNGAVEAMEILSTLSGEHAPESGARRIAYDIRASHPPIPARIEYLRELAAMAEATQGS